MIEVFWDDLTKEKQQEILDVFGDNCNYDTFPIITISTPGDEDYYRVDEHCDNCISWKTCKIADTGDYTNCGKDGNGDCSCLQSEKEEV